MAAGLHLYSRPGPLQTIAFHNGIAAPAGPARTGELQEMPASVPEFAIPVAEYAAESS
jgi:hypothetical protein